MRRAVSAASAGVSIVLITQSSSEYSISFCIESADKVKAKQVLSDAFELELKDGLLEPVEFMDDVAIVTLVGDGMRTSRGVASQFFSSLAEVNVNIVAIAQGSSERAISAVIPEDKISEAIKACHENLFNSKHFLDVFVVGVGGVGGELVDQIQRQQGKLAEKGIVIRVCGLANSKGLLLDSEGLPLEQWRDRMSSSVTSMPQLRSFSATSASSVGWNPHQAGPRIRTNPKPRHPNIREKLSPASAAAASGGSSRAWLRSRACRGSSCPWRCRPSASPRPCG